MNDILHYTFGPLKINMDLSLFSCFFSFPPSVPKPSYIMLDFRIVITTYLKATDTNCTLTQIRTQDSLTDLTFDQVRSMNECLEHWCSEIPNSWVNAQKTDVLSPQVVEMMDAHWCLRYLIQHYFSVPWSPPTIPHLLVVMCHCVHANLLWKRMCMSLQN